jgi:hypothetical protein
MVSPELSRKAAKLFNDYKVSIDKGFDWAIELESAKSEADLSPELQKFLAEPYMMRTKPKSLEKHLSGQHDQSTHGKGGSTHTHPKVDAIPSKREYKNSDYSKLQKLPEGNPELEAAALLYTTSSHYINKQLRYGPAEGASQATIEGNKQRAKVLEEAVRSVETTEDMVVQRGVSWETFGVENRLGIPSNEADVKSLIGQAFADKGFLSCSTILMDGKKIPINQFQKRDVQLRISVPKGSKGVALNEWEHEFLMPPNTAILITNVELNRGRPSIIDAVVVGQNANK